VNGIVAPFVAGDQNLCLDEDGELYKVASSISATDVGAAYASQSLSFHREYVIIPDPAGAAAPKAYNGTSISTLGGTPPFGKYASVFLDRSILAAPAALPQRIYFSAAGDPATWDTTNAWMDADHKLCGVAANGGTIIAFTDHGVERWRGSIPPPGSDFTHTVLADGSAPYTASICTNGSNVFWASQDGIFMTDGASVYDLTFDCGMKSYWQALVASGASWNVSAGILADRYLVVSVMNGVTRIDCMVIDVPLRRCWRWSNIDAWGMWPAGPHLYFGRRNAAFVGDLASTFAKSAAVKSDPGGADPVRSYIETRFYKGSSGLKTWRAIYLDYDLRDAATDNPIIGIAYILSPESSSYVPPTVYWLNKTVAATRSRLEINKKSEGIGLLITRSYASADFRLYGIDADIYAMERSRTS
jgi:hypothetical protein